MAGDEKWRSIPVTIKELSIADVLPTGQAFRWFKTGEDPEEWSGVIAERIFSLRQTEKELNFLVHNKTDTTDEDESIIKDYFQLDALSLHKLYSDWSGIDKIMHEACQNCPGVRILNQDPFETLVAFICSSNNNISRISLMVNKLCRHFGTPLGIHRDREFYGFPSPKSLASDSVEGTLRELGFGYRAKYVTGAVEYLLRQESKDWLSSLRQLSYQEAWDSLQVIPGVGPKVADCVCLMGLQKYEAVPVDVHIWRVAEKLYGLKLTCKTLSLAGYRQIGDMFRNKYGIYAGIAQAVLFRREILKKV